MSLLSILTKIGGVAAAPFTGGASLIPTIASVAGDVGSVLGKQQQGKTQGQITQAQLQQQQDRNALDAYQTAQSAQNAAAQTDLQRKGFETNNRATTAKQALIGALLGGGITPTSIGPQGASGGLLRSLNANPEALAALKMLSSQASSAQSTPLQFSGGEMLKPPTQTALPKIDNGGFLSTLANIGQLVGAASPYLKKPGSEASD